jgi:hypothetical protein
MLASPATAKGNPLVSKVLMREEYLFVEDEGGPIHSRFCVICGALGVSWVNYQCREGIRHLLHCTGHTAMAVSAGSTLCNTCASFAEVTGTQPVDQISLTMSLEIRQG